MAIDDDTFFRQLFQGEPLADDGHVTLSSKPASAWI
jgi:hypothetical protein